MIAAVRLCPIRADLERFSVFELHHGSSHWLSGGVGDHSLNRPRASIIVLTKQGAGKQHRDEASSSGQLYIHQLYMHRGAPLISTLRVATRLPRRYTKS